MALIISFLNKGDIILASGNNIVGVMIDVEQMQDADRKSHTTKNDGRIIINRQNSIGIDFGQYNFQEVTKVDVTLGNIIGGTVFVATTYWIAFLKKINKRTEIFDMYPLYRTKYVSIKEGIFIFKFGYCVWEILC